MINRLKDINKATPISMLPEILNKNNQSLRDEFDYIFDSSNCCLTKSVRIPQGSVQAHFGEFQYLSADNVSIGNPDPIVSIIRSNIDRFSHNEFIDIFSSVEIKKNYNETIQKEINICHDASVIGLPVYNYKKFLNLGDDEVLTVYNVIDKCLSKIETLEKKVNNLQINSNNASPARYTAQAVSLLTTDTEPIITETTVYPKSYLGATGVHLRRLNIPKTHILDLTSNRFMTYYPAADTIEVSNTNPVFVETDKVGSVVNLEFVRTTASPFRILLARESGKAVKMTINELNRLQLRCIGYSEDYGPEWDIHSYSVPSKNDIEIIKL